jgi:hypothetical protein
MLTSYRAIAEVPDLVAPEGGTATACTPGRGPKVTRLRFDRGHKARSLMWSGDSLVDAAGGQASVALDGTTKPSSVNWAFDFDRAVAAPSGLRALYTALGTKGLVATSRHHVREVNRSYYHANAYEYPLAVGALADGTEVLAHCPDGYNRLRIETLARGERLCTATENALDVFHSRLRFSPDGRYLLSAGWVRRPAGVAAVYDTAEALAEPRHLDGAGVIPQGSMAGHVDAACWLSPELLAVSTDHEEGPLDNDSDGLAPGQLGVWSFREDAWVARHVSQGHTGTMHAVGRYLLCLFDHPRLVDPMTAQVVEEWPELKTGRQVGSIIWHLPEPVPPFALDPVRRRFAVAHKDVVSVVELDQ